MKRALMTFGNPFGLALYDKAQRQVSSAAGQRSTPSAPPDPGLTPLDAETIRQLHGALRALPRPLLESLTGAFRKRFEVPDDAVTIADRINQKQHHDWIEAFLVRQT